MKIKFLSIFLSLAITICIEPNERPITSHIVFSNGDIKISDATVDKLNLEAGVGNVSISADIRSDSSVKLGCINIKGNPLPSPIVSSHPPFSKSEDTFIKSSSPKL